LGEKEVFVENVDIVVRYMPECDGQSTVKPLREAGFRKSIAMNFNKELPNQALSSAELHFVGRRAFASRRRRHERMIAAGIMIFSSFAGERDRRRGIAEL